MVAYSIECDDFLADPAFHWSPISGFDLSRRPPNVFGRPLASLVMSPIRSLPNGMSLEEQAFFNGIFEVLRDLQRVYQLLQELSSELKQMKSPGKNAEQIYHTLLLRYENKAQISLESVDHPLTSVELKEILARGSIFIDRNDDFIEAHLNPQIPALQGKWKHKKWVHRLQLHLILRDFQRRPEAYGSPKSFVALFKLLGSEELYRRLDWSDTNVPPGDLFVHLFDSMENNGSSPGFFSEYQNYWPDIPQI